jgi:hypothetical protein
MTERVKNTVFYIIIMAVFASCDKIEYPFEQLPVYDICGKNVPYIVTYSDTNTSRRNILIEEFTGHTCNNCPDGAREVQRIDSIYKPQIIPVSIHAGAFAKPKNNPDSSYSTDFRTPEGEIYFGPAGFNVWGNPSAMVSRTIMNGNKVLQKADWENAVVSIKSDVPQASVAVTNWYNDSLRCLKTKTSIKWLSSAITGISGRGSHY